MELKDKMTMLLQYNYRREKYELICEVKNKHGIRCKETAEVNKTFVSYRRVHLNSVSYAVMDIPEVEKIVFNFGTYGLSFTYEEFERMFSNIMSVLKE